MKAGLNREDYLAWFKRVDEGPFHSLSCGERVHGPTYDMRALLSAAAIATSRVKITPTLYVLPMHSAVGVAKEVATMDILSGGRMEQICVGYGGRAQDYQAMGQSMKGRYQRMDDQVKTMRQVWAGEEVISGAGSIGPTPTQPGGPKILAGALGPKSIARCAKWADGLYAWSGNGEKHELANAFATADRAWQEAGRSEKPYRMGGFWYSLADDAQSRLYDYVYNYLDIAGPEIAKAMAQSVTRSNAEALREALDNAEAAGCEELFLVPATADLSEIDRLCEILESR
ncbi:LLM class flavin-dependent oxidoreductase [Parahaliea sp. F7430]|uniref:LLM class flavin-dependent oxidoreductase n=2 Tax=Sediminihaliea albiluteola TaxID=2758564 RepID=A0A7W2YIX1_9GAMM|nr:LLM class flavin-dependent oxidoreductase [Sediminihaliea albiluteola]